MCIRDSLQPGHAHFLHGLGLQTVSKDPTDNAEGRDPDHLQHGAGGSGRSSRTPAGAGSSYATAMQEPNSTSHTSQDITQSEDDGARHHRPTVGQERHIDAQEQYITEQDNFFLLLTKFFLCTCTTYNVRSS